MTKATVNEVIKRAVSDAAFRRQLQRDPSGTLAGFELTAEERAAITGGDPSKLMSLGIDQRMSKAFVIGGLAGTANASVEGATSSNTSLIDEEAAAGSTSGIQLDPGHTSGTSVIAGDPGSASVTAFDTTSPSGDLNTIDPGIVTSGTAARELVDAGSAGGRSAALDDPARSEDMSAVSGTDTTGDLNTIDPGFTGGAVAAREAASAGGRSAALTDPARNEADASVVETGSAGGRSAALTDPARSEDSAATAFEPASDSGDLNAIDPGIVENDTSGSGAGPDSGGDGPIEH